MIVFGYRFPLPGLIGFSALLIWSIVAISAPLIAPHGVGEIVDFDIFTPMSDRFLFGTDYLGRDVFSRILMGARVTIGIAFLAVTFAVSMGVGLGMTAALIGGRFDTVLSRFLDALSSIPSKLFALVAVAGGGSSIPMLIFILAIIYTPGSYRFARSLAVNVNAMDYVTVARLRGEKLPYLAFSEILPNILGPVLTDFGLRFVFIVLLLSGLSFLGLGVQPPIADWGALVRENIGGLSFAAPAVIAPSLALASLTIAVNMTIDNLPVKIRDRSE